MDTEITENESSIEIELKFLVSDTIIPQIPAIVTQFAKKVTNKPAKNLQNAYFDTPSRELRALDIGLRTRCFGETSQNTQCEQTIKLAGQVIGGMHQRPEYNLPLSGKLPDLTQFDANIWPHGMQVQAINQNIYPIFTTHFIRRTWIIETQAGSVIELVLDKGEVSGAHKVEPICEVEIELVSGDKFELFALADKLLASSQVRLGLYSKAARGYMLADDKPLTADSKLSDVKLKPADTVEQAFEACLSHGLAFMQKHEQCYINLPSLSALKRIYDGVSLIKHSFTLFAEMFSKEANQTLITELNWLSNKLNWIETASQLKSYTSKKHAYYKKINSAPELNSAIDELKLQHPDQADLNQLFHSERYNKLLLNLTLYLVQASWREKQNIAQLTFAKQKVVDVADELFEQMYQSVTKVVTNTELTEAEYLSYKPQLDCNLLTGCCLGSLFSQSRRDEFRTPWLDIIHGIDELNTLSYLKQICDAQNDSSVVKVQTWLKQKSDNLLVAMEQSRFATANLTPYWR